MKEENKHEYDAFFQPSPKFLTKLNISKDEGLSRCEIFHYCSCPEDLEMLSLESCIKDLDNFFIGFKPSQDEISIIDISENSIILKNALTLAVRIGPRLMQVPIRPLSDKFNEIKL